MAPPRLRLAARSLRAQPGYTLLNLTGLAVGLACGLLLLLHLHGELSYDRFGPAPERVFRLVADINAGGVEQTPAMTPAPWGPALVEDVPEVEAAARVNRFAQAVLVRHGERADYEDAFLWADAAAVRIFGYRLLRGDPATALAEPFTVVLTEATAARYFGNADPVGKTLTVDEKHDYRVTGVVEAPARTHLPFDFLASFSSLEGVFSGEAWRLEHWAYHSYYTYLLLQDPADAPAVAGGMPAFIARHGGERLAALYTNAYLEPLPDLYLTPARSGDYGPRGNAAYLAAFGAVGVLVLLIAGINFVNLTTARAARRMKEVGVRKVLGARRAELVQGFLVESVGLALAAAALAVGLALAARPFYADLSGLTLPVGAVVSGPVLLGLVAVASLVGVGAGLYPALLLTRPAPTEALRQAGAGSVSRGRLRKTLVVAQFAASIFLLATTFVVFEQVRFMERKDLGFSREGVVVVPMQDRSLRAQHETVLEAFRRVPGVRHAAASSAVPGALFERYAYRPEGAEEPMTLPMLSASHELLETLGLRLVAGRTFDPARPADAEAFLVNEALVETLGWDEPVGKGFEWVRPGQEPVRGEVIGVVENFHLTSLRESIEPVVLHVVPGRFNFFTARVSGGDPTATLAGLEAAWSGLRPAWPFAPRHLGDAFDALVVPERRLGRLFVALAALAAFVACLGLFGLASYAAEQRRKEIGIRKVLGASSSGIFGLMLGSFVRLVLVATAVALPLAYLGTQRWLDDFAYRITVSPVPFVAAALIALAVAVFAVGGQALRAATCAPSRTLRYE